MRPGATAIRRAIRPALAEHRRGALALALPLFLLGFLLGCTSEAPADEPSASPTVTATTPPEARAQLAALAAAAQDRHLTASYTLSVDGRPDRTVVLTSATDRTWRVDIPGGALGGTADVSVAQTADGIFQCALPSARWPDPASCVRLGAPERRLPASVDPRVQHTFTDWRDVLTDRQVALSVSTTPPLTGARGQCFAVESTAASLDPPLDVGIYCYDVDGTLTGARLGYGTLVLAGAPGAAPASVTLPGPVVDREPLRMAAPPREDPPVSPSVSPEQ